MLIIPGNDEAAIKVRSEEQLTQVTDRLKREKAKANTKNKTPKKLEKGVGLEEGGRSGDQSAVEGKLKDLLGALVDENTSDDEDEGDDTDSDDKGENEKDDAELLLKAIDKLAKIRKKR